MMRPPSDQPDMAATRDLDLRLTDPAALISDIWPANDDEVLYAFLRQSQTAGADGVRSRNRVVPSQRG